MRPIHAQVSHRMTTCNCKDMRRHHQSNAALHFTRPNRGLLYSISSAASRYCARRCAHTSKNHLYSRIFTADLLMISWPMIPKAEALHGYRYQCWKNCWYNFLRKMKTNWEVEMNQYYYNFDNINFKRWMFNWCACLQLVCKSAINYVMSPVIITIHLCDIVSSAAAYTKAQNEIHAKDRN